MLTPAKIACFTSIAQQVMPFLKVFQADKPMIPFICEDLLRLVKGLMDRFIKSEVMQTITQIEDLVKTDINNKENYCKNKEMVVGFVAEKELKRLLSAKKVSERQALEFRNECRSFLVSVINNMTEKTPLKYPLAKHLSCLDPRAMARDEAGSKGKMKCLLNALVSAKRLIVSQCDEILRQYSEYLDTVAKVKMQYREFDLYDVSSRLDSLLSEDMGRQPQYSTFWSTVKNLLLLSHGQASVERGFSINKEIEVENLAEESVVAQRVMCETVMSLGGIHNVDISKSLLVSAAAGSGI